jgi:hypothetical protein
MDNLDEWMDNSKALQQGCTYLERTYQLLCSGKLYAFLEVMQMLVQWHPDAVTLWTEECGNPGVLFGCPLAKPQAMALARSVSAGSLALVETTSFNSL